MRKLVPAVAIVLSVTLSGCVFISANLNPFASTPEPLREETVSGEGAAKVVLIDISNIISDHEDRGAFGLSQRPGMTARVREQLEKAADDDRVKAVLLRINSPGGTVTASDTIYHEIMRFKARQHVPVVAHMMDLGTSGAYYIAAAADEIVASPTTVTGSVGVIFVGVNVSGLMDKIGLKNQTLKAGARKDAGSPLRPMTADDERLLQALLDDMQARFLGVVRQRRQGMSEEAFKRISDARVLTAGQALQAGMVDRIGYLEDAIELSKQRAGVGDARVVIYHRSEEYAENIYSRSTSQAPQINLVNFDLGGLPHGPQFMYMWLPGAEAMGLSGGR